MCSSQLTNNHHYRWCFFKLYSPEKDILVHNSLQRSSKVMKINLKNSNVRNLTYLQKQTLRYPETSRQNKCLKTSGGTPNTLSPNLLTLSSSSLSPNTHTSTRAKHTWLCFITISRMAACIFLPLHLVA